MYTVTNENDKIGLDAALRNNMIMGVVDKDNNRTCIMQSHSIIKPQTEYKLSKFVILPFINCKKIHSEDMSLSCFVEIEKITDIVSFTSSHGFKPVKAFNDWKEAYEWILGIEKEKDEE